MPSAKASSAAILQRLHTYHPQVIDLSLRRSFFTMLEKLGNPHLKLPPVIHVAGTNGKGSTIAYLRAMLEAQGKRVHVYTSPHLVTFHERIRLAGRLIEEKLLVELLEECEQANAAGEVTFFELTTIVAFLAFSRVPADVVLLETGLGGRLDATNIVPRPALCIITHISRDHMEFLGNSLAEIAAEKAGIFKHGVPAVIAPQNSAEVIGTLKDKAAKTGAPLFIYNHGWRYALTGDGFTFISTHLTHPFPLPALLGDHQIANAATAIAALSQLPDLNMNHESLTRGLREVTWPARLQPLKTGPLTKKLTPGAELWLDGGHNDSAGVALAHQAAHWKEEYDKPLFLIVGMLSSKQPHAFLNPLAPFVSALGTVTIPDEPKSFTAAEIAEAAGTAGIAATPFETVESALDFCLQQAAGKPARILITGSLYLAGIILRDHG